MADPNAKFLFDTVFDMETMRREERRKKPVGPPLVHTEQALVDAVNRVREETYREAFAEGRRAGVAEVRESIDVHIGRAQEAIARTLPLLANMRAQIALDARREAVELGHLIARKLAGALLERLPAADVAAMIDRTVADLAEMTKDAQVTIRVAPPLVDAITKAASDVVQRAGSGIRATVVGDPSLQGSACRVEWPEGGSDRDPSLVQAEIGRAVERYLLLLNDLPEFQGVRAAADPSPNAPDLKTAVDGIAAAADKSVAAKGTDTAAPTAE
jgi:flagellar assembly protein FliH